MQLDAKKFEDEVIRAMSERSFVRCLSKAVEEIEHQCMLHALEEIEGDGEDSYLAEGVDSEDDLAEFETRDNVRPEWAQSNVGPRLQDVPWDVLVRIAGGLHSKDLLSLGLTCHALAEAVLGWRSTSYGIWRDLTHHRFPEFAHMMLKERQGYGILGSEDPAVTQGELEFWRRNYLRGPLSVEEIQDLKDDKLLTYIRKNRLELDNSRVMR